MRKYLILLIVVVFLLCGCSGTAKNDDNVCFYYYSMSALYDNTQNIIVAEPVHADLNGMSIKDIISKYLQGTNTEHLNLPFTSGTTVISIEESTDKLTVLLSNECAQMQQLELTLAGSCLARTLFQFSQAQSIAIETEEGFSYAENELVFTRDNIIIDDLIPAY